MSLRAAFIVTVPDLACARTSSCAVGVSVPEVQAVFVPAHSIVTGSEASPTGGLRTGFVLHGILGSGRNWRRVARELVTRAPGWRFVLVDLRHHGASSGAPPPDTLASCARDLVRLGEHLGAPPSVVAGHSFGGKVALAYAALGPQDLEQVWVFDSSPSPRAMDIDQPSRHELSQVLETIARVPQPLAERDALRDFASRAGWSEVLTGWMMTNLTRSTDKPGYVWRFNLSAVKRLLQDYFSTDAWPVVERLAAENRARLRVIRGGRSTTLSSQDVARLRDLSDRDAIDFETLEDAGHWLHVDAFGPLMSVLERWVKSAPA